MLLEELQLDEMAKPVKICDKCGKQMSKFHFWYKGAWKCKGQPRTKSSTPKAEKVHHEKGDGSKLVKVDGKYEVRLSKELVDFAKALDAKRGERWEVKAKAEKAKKLAAAEAADKAKADKKKKTKVVHEGKLLTKFSRPAPDAAKIRAEKAAKAKKDAEELADIKKADEEMGRAKKKTK